MGRIISIIFTLGCLGFAAMTYDNVYTDVEPIKVLAEGAACAKEDCKKPHALFQIDRNFRGQTLFYRFGSDVVNVDCARQWFAVGDRHCRVM
jgi:hypothetical protein